MLEIKAPNTLPPGGPVVFLAGSIEMGAAEQWQARVVDALLAHLGYVLNPRRDYWDASWEQTANNPQFREQVEWELGALERADHILLYLSPGTRAPVSLLELGLWARSGKLAVCCPEGFWRRGNVEIVCERHGVPLFSRLGDAVRLIEERLRGVGVPGRQGVGLEFPSGWSYPAHRVGRVGSEQQD